MWTRAFWAGAVERMVRTAVQMLAAALAADYAAGASLAWQAYATAILVGVVSSLAMSMGANATNAGPAGSASMVFDRPADVGVVVTEAPRGT